ncbi:MAG TPA: fused response regulator/phosphatase [Candidatus Tectomicrobia bacterium]
MSVVLDIPLVAEANTTSDAPSDRAPLRILIVDDDATNRLILSAMLARDGHTVLMAADGQEAIEVFTREQPDLVLLDVVMPNVDGYEVARYIKAHTGERFVPVVFLTALHDETALLQCVAAGGDDFLTKPYRRTILQAKLRAMERTRALYTTLQVQKDELVYHHTRLQREQDIAQEVFDRVVHRKWLEAPHIRYLLSPMALFNGDMLLAAPPPSGGLHVMLGDFTGHGLPAAIGAMPVSDIFYDMTAKGYAIGDIVAAINQKLKAILPTGVFCAACLLAFDAAYRTLAVWNGGLPEVFLYEGRTRQLRRLASQHLPLGIVGNVRFDRSIELLEVSPEDRVYAYTDGVIEARNTDDEMFGQQRLETAVVQAQHSDTAFEGIRDGLLAFRAGEQQSDDLTLIEIVCDASLANNGRVQVPIHQASKLPTAWQITLELSADILRTVDPLPQIMQMLTEFQGFDAHREALYIVLAELFTNALEHGLLGLDSTLKHTPQGFSAYYTMREQRLAILDEGWIKVAVTHMPQETGGKLVLRVEDSGPGFDYQRQALHLPHNTTRSGRGLPLVRSLCQELVYHGTGNCVEAIYVWH